MTRKLKRTEEVLIKTDHTLLKLTHIEIEYINMPPLETTLKGNEIYPPQLLSKKLNNRASFLITTRKYDESIALLTRALKLTEKKFHAATPMECSLLCKSCSLESCVSMERESYSSIMECEKRGCNGREVYRHVPSCDCGKQEDQNFEMKFNEYHQPPPDTVDGFVYRRPLLIPHVCIEEDHYMGVVLSLVILYNLALSHHLKALATDDSPRPARKILNQSLKLYELTYQLHLDYEQKRELQEHHSEHQSMGSLRFTMIIANNLGQIHKAAGNAEKHQMCLHHLLSAIMYMVDSHQLVLDSSEMDGFYENVSPIITSEHCARAA